MPFSQLSPAIVAYDNTSTTLYIKSDQVFASQELVYYHDRGKDDSFIILYLILAKHQLFFLQVITFCRAVSFSIFNTMKYSLHKVMHCLILEDTFDFETTGYNPQTFQAILHLSVNIATKAIQFQQRWSCQYKRVHYR